MFRNLPKYAETASNSFWSTRTPAHWAVRPGLAVLQENRRKNTGMIETQVLSLSYGRVVVKPLEKQRGLVPDSYEGYQVLEPGDIVVRPTDLQNDQTSVRVGQVKDHGIITSAYIGLRTAGDWDGAYAYRYLTTIDSTKRIYGMGSGLRQQLGWADLKRMPCLVPPIEEQAAIAKYLAHANARIDKAIAAKRRLIALLNELAASVQNSIVTAVTEGDEIVSIGQTSSLVQTGPFGSQLHAEEYVDNGIPIINPAHIGALGVTPDPSIGVSPEKAEELRRHRFETGDIVLARRGDLGRCAVVQTEQAGWLCGTGSLIVRLHRDRWNPEYFQMAFSSKGNKERLQLSSVGSTMANLNASQIARMRLQRPPLARQEAAVLEMRSAQADHASRLAMVVREIALLQEFRTRLIADVVTGQVDVRAIAASLPDNPEQDTHLDALLDDDLEDELGESEE